MAGGDSDRLTNGKQTIDAELHDDTLKKHLASIEAKRVAMRYEGREGGVKTAEQMMQGKDVVMSSGEPKTLEKAWRKA
jgi:predicted glutamine amidotransferase